MPADIETAAAEARAVDKTQCTGNPCGGSPREKECGGPGRLLAYAYSCDSALPLLAEGDNGASPNVDANQLGHNPALSYSMRIDV